MLPVGAGRCLAASVDSRVTELEWASPISPWFLFLVVIPVIIGYVAYIYRRERLSPGGPGSAGPPERGRAPAVADDSRKPPEPEGAGAASPQAGRVRSMRGALIALRVLLLLLLVAILAEPVIRTTRYRTVDSSIIVMVDDSLSMDIKDKYADRELVQKLADFFRSTPEMIENTTRYDLVRRLFRDSEIGFIPGLREKGRLVICTFAGAVRRLKELGRQPKDEPDPDWNEPEVLPPQETVRAEGRVRQTRISDSLLDAVAGERLGGLGGLGGRIAGVILLTDGQQTPGARSLEDVARRLGQRDIPVHTVGIGNPEEPKDIRVVNLDVNDIVLAGDQVPFDVSLVGEGYEGEQVRVELQFDGETVAADYVVLEGEGRRQAVRLNYRPPNPGDFLVTVQVEERPGELFRENNVASRSIKVLDQKIKVLYAEGPPRWEYRYLKNGLIRDPTMLAQVFLFQADPDFIQESSPGIPPLAGFPETKEELFEYHVVILGDVDVAQELTSRQITLLREFVTEAGGGLVFLAGQNANPAEYLHTDLYALLPVEVPEGGRLPADLEASPVTSSFNVELTPVGREHEIMRLDNSRERNLQLWENRDGQDYAHLPGFYWFADVGKAKKGAVVLARHPTKVHPADQKGRVIFAFMNHGKGRTFFSAVDNTWRWRAGVDNQYFYRFWGQVIRFCATGRLLGRTPRYSIATDKSSYTVGETVSIDARVFDANMKPLTDPGLTVFHQARGGDVEKLELDLDPVQGQGAYRGGMVATRVGLHDIWLGTEADRLAFRTFEVVVPALERRDPRRNVPLLRETAELSGGTYRELFDVTGVIGAIEGESRSQEGEVETDALWDEWWVLVLFTVIIGLEWILRKSVNLL